MHGGIWPKTGKKKEARSMDKKGGWWQGRMATERKRR
jgi:hypothetical protein